VHEDQRRALALLDVGHMGAIRSDPRSGFRSVPQAGRSRPYRRSARGFRPLR
jgi:hypothetical protein